MVEEKRRAPRTEVEMPIALILRDEKQGTVLVGPVQGMLTALSSYGAGLMLNKICIEGKHLFYAPQDDPSKILFLEIEQEENTALSIPVYPVWFNCDEEDEDNPFQMGIEFMLESGSEGMKALNKMLRHKKKEGKSWWKFFSLKKE